MSEVIRIYEEFFEQDPHRIQEAMERLQLASTNPAPDGTIRGEPLGTQAKASP